MYNNPYYYPYMNIPNNIPYNGILNIRPKGNLLKGLSNIKWGDVLNNTQKTLNVINQAIPVYYQIKPIFGNIRSLSKLVTAFNEDDKVIENDNQNIKKENSSNTPTFFIN